MKNQALENKKLHDEFCDIRRLIYGKDPSRAKDLIAVDRLSVLVEKQIPHAILLQAVLIWHGYGFDEDPERAHLLAKKAAELGELDALVVLASMHFLGYGCERSFEKSLVLLKCFNSEASSIPFLLRVGKVGLNYLEFRTGLVFNIKGKRVFGSLGMLEELNRWTFFCKRKCIDQQAEILKRNPSALSYTPYRCLPFKGSIGGSCFSLKGGDFISHVGFHNIWLREVIWFETDQFIGWPASIGFDGLTEFEDWSETELAKIGRVYSANRHRNKDFELKFIGSSVHCELKLFCGEEELMSVFKD